jgi:hypothetical protein
MITNLRGGIAKTLNELHVKNMSAVPLFDLAAAHRWFSADYFNRVWALLEKADRTAEDNERMISLCHASLAHWQDRPDCTAQNLSIGWWQLSRVHAVLGQGELAMHTALHCLDASHDEPPFFLGYAHEAIARAAKLMGNCSIQSRHRDFALQLAATVDDAGNRAALEADLGTID